MEIAIGDIVTVDFKNSKASNTFIVFRKTIFDSGEVAYLLHHPLAPELLIEKYEEELNQVGSQLKDSTERSLDFIKANSELLDFNGRADLLALCTSFILTRKLTPQQKRILSGLGGFVASMRFNNEVRDAMDYIVQNEAVLDDFNRMWYNNFSGLFKGNQPITSKKQRSAIFNMAGFTLAELENPIAAK